MSTINDKLKLAYINYLGLTGQTYALPDLEKATYAAIATGGDLAAINSYLGTSYASLADARPAWVAEVLANGVATSSATLLFQDSFTDANSTVLTAHTPDTNTLGSGTWLNTGLDNHVINNNKMDTTSSGVSFNVIDADITTTSGVIIHVQGGELLQGNIHVGFTDDTSALGTSTNKTWYGGLTNSGTFNDELTLWDRNGGTATNRINTSWAGKSAQSPNIEYYVKVETDGTVSFYEGDRTTLVASGAISNITFANYKYLVAYTEDVGDRIDTLTVYDTTDFNELPQPVVATATFEDTFDGEVANTTILSHTPDTDDLGGGWVTVTNELDHTISPSGYAYETGADVNENHVTLDADSSDDIYVKYTTDTDEYYVMIMFPKTLGGSVVEGSWWVINNGGSIDIREDTSGGTIARGTVSRADTSGTYIIEFKAATNTVNVYENSDRSNVLVTGTLSSPISNASVGFRARNNGRLDSLAVYKTSNINEVP